MLKLSQPITSINGFKIGDIVRLKDGDGRPHIIKSFSIDGMKEFFFEVQFEDGTETMLNNIAPLPSNLDEAAKKVRSRVKEIFDSLPKYDIDEERHNRVEFSLNALEAFALLFYQAGAEWMAGQGSSREVEVKEDAGGYPYIPSIELYDYDKDEPLFKPGDKVVVQIRKK